MAIDTQHKRMSMIGFGSPVPSMLPRSSIFITKPDRYMLLWLFLNDSGWPETGLYPKLVTLWMCDTQHILYMP